jgi:ATP-dependent DNA helicase RecG
MTGYKLSKEAKIRLKTMCETTDGFRIAEVDLELRGPGELEGTRQSGGLDFVMVNLVTDLQILDQVQKMVAKIIERDPELIHPSNKLLLEYLHQEELRSPGWSKIS